MKDKILHYIIGTKLYGNFLKVTRKIKFKRYENVSLNEVIAIFLRKVTSDDIIQRSYGVAFNFTMAIFPAIIFLFTLIPFIHNFIPEVNSENILNFIGEMMPPSMFDVVSSTIEDIIGNTRGGLLTFGALFSLYLAANGVLSLMNAFNSCYKTVDKRGFFKTRMIAIGLTIMLAFVLILAIVLLVVGSIVIDFLADNPLVNIDDYVVYLILILRFIVMFIVFFLAISFIYYFGPAVHYNWSFFSLGSFIASFLCLAASYGFSLYISNFGTYNKLYGSIGALIALMMWQFILTVIMMVGHEINASLHYAHRIVGDEEIRLPEKRKKKVTTPQ
ncbi:MAG: YihY/virulence factor BrkB family protein [Cyclobacteriaceae bacterium]|nr:YihY/virulence factor BrkB family protein [Cyclobacteriaceae bacterium]